MAKLLPFLLITFLIFSHPEAKANLDSLKVEFEKAAEDTTKVQLLIEMGDLYYQTQRDTAYKYYHQALDFLQTTAMDHQKLHEQKGTLLRYIGIIYRSWGNFSTALNYYQEALDIFLEQDFREGISSVYNNFGVVYRNLGNYAKAIEYYHQALPYFEETENHFMLASCFNNISICYNELGEAELALDYLLQAKEIYEEHADPITVARADLNLGSIYYDMNEPDKAYDYYNQALEMFLLHGLKAQAAFTYLNLSYIYGIWEDFEKAIEKTEKARVLAEETNSLKSLSAIYIAQTKLYRIKGDYPKSLQKGQKALEIAYEINTLVDKVSTYLQMKLAAEASGDIAAAYNYASSYITLNDSLQDKERKKLIFELETRYQTEKKQQEIELLQEKEEINRLQLIQNQAEIQRQRFILFLVIFILLAGLVFLYLQYRQNRKVSDANQKLEKQNKEIQRKNQEIRLQRNELEKQSNLVLDQKIQIEKQNESLKKANREILSGIRYAEKVQSSLFPDEEYLNAHLGNSFILFRPKSIVSGDFYWVSSKNGKTMIAAADCTGHGVAGGLLSMLGVAFLNESLHRTSLKTAADYMNYLTRRFDTSLLVSEEGRSAMQGMEVSFCIYDREKNTIQFSGADASIAVARTNKLEIFKGEHQNFGQTPESQRTFSCKEIQTSPGDMVYIFSDGFIDQFGGEHGARYTSAGFYKLLENVSRHTLPYQKSLLENELENWKGNHFEQVDDILVIGFRI